MDCYPFASIHVHRVYFARTQLENYAAGTWVKGSGKQSELLDASTGELIATTVGKSQDTRHKSQDTRHKSQDTSHKTQVTRHKSQGSSLNDQGLPILSNEHSTFAPCN